MPFFWSEDKLPNYSIAGLVLRIDLPFWAAHENLRAFEIDSMSHDIHCAICFEDFSKDSFSAKDPQVLAEVYATSIYSYKGTIVKTNDRHDIPSCIIAANNYTEWELYVSPDFFPPEDEDVIMDIKEGILAGLRDVIIIVLSRNNGLLLHSCSILWEEQVIAFSGKSGVGKSTHARLWQEKYGVSILDGDVTACRVLKDGAIAYGLPWCGTSGQFLNQSGILRAVVFLQQAKNNNIRKLDFKESYMYLVSRCFLLPWSNELTHDFLDVAQELATNTEFYLLECLPDFEAVEMVKKCLDLS